MDPEDSKHADSPPQDAVPDADKAPAESSENSAQAQPSALYIDPMPTPGGFNPNEPHGDEKVYPIRSVVSVNSPTQILRRGTHAGDVSPSIGKSDASDTGIDRRLSSPTDTSPASGFQYKLPTTQTPRASFREGGGAVRSPNDYFDLGRRRGSGSDFSDSSSTVSRKPLYAGDIFHDHTDSKRSASGAARPRQRLGDGGDELVAPGEGNSSYLTTRFKHLQTAEGHSIITGRDGEAPQLCEDEPIHIPGAIQGFGVLIALKEDNEGKLVVRVVSENSGAVISYSPRELFSLTNFTDIMPAEQAETFFDHLDFIKDEETDTAQEGPEVFSLSLSNPNYDAQTHRRTERHIKVWCALHIADRSRGLIVCELELEDDIVNPVVASGEETPEPPEDTLQNNPTAEELAESTTSLSKPLRVLRHARKRKGDGAAMEVFNIMSQLQEQLASASSLEKFLNVLVGIVKQLTGFHRVMIYQFDKEFNGRVVSELVDPRATKDLYKGLNFPASDIPRQARDLYKVNKVRLLYDRDQETARLCCRTEEDLAVPLDLTHSYLRAMSPIHLKYLTNMAVRSSMSISITVFNDLWGLISCHSYGTKGMRVTFPVRKMCRIVGDIASRNIERLSYASRLQARKLINTVPTESNPSGYIVASSDDLLNLFDADFGILSIKGETKVLGKLDNSQEALAMLEYLRMRSFSSVFTSQDVNVDFPDLVYSPGFSSLAGLLLVPLSSSGEDFIAFFRKAQLRTVKWAGNPYEKLIKAGTAGYLEPRKSFKVWNETVANKSREWTEEQVETAAVLCLVYGKFIEVWRQKEAALQTSQLTRLLLANASHEVRTPLNAIINYLEIAMEGRLDQDTRENLAKSHSASKSLIYVINDLLDLTRAEDGRDLVKDETFDLRSTIQETTNTFKADADRKKLSYEVTEYPGVPQFVKGDQRKIRQAISNLMANAIQHTATGGIKIEIWPANLIPGSCEIGIAVQDTGKGMSAEKLDLLFQELEQVQTADDEQLSIQNNTPDQPSQNKSTLGLGLAVVARIVRNMNGQLRLKSEEGKGSRFIIQIPFQLSGTPGDPDPNSLQIPRSGVSSPSIQSGEGERTLVNASSILSSRGSRPDFGRRQSNESLGSRKSASSGQSAKSEADRLIDAIQGSPMSPKDPKTRKLSFDGQFKPSSQLETAGSRASLPVPARPGEERVTDEVTPLRAVRIAEPETEDVGHTLQDTQSRSLPSTSDISSPISDPPTKPQLSVLVAEDDPINSRIMARRLEKQGHTAKLTVNGQECANVFAEGSSQFDFILMDMQMPIVNGLTSTQMIRKHETSPTVTLSNYASLNRRIPIFAVSASLREQNKEQYIEAGFDGWILKPVDFQRLDELMMGVFEEEKRNAAVYVKGEWERGGWFAKRDPTPQPTPNA